MLEVRCDLWSEKGCHKRLFIPFFIIFLHANNPSLTCNFLQKEHNILKIYSHLRVRSVQTEILYCPVNTSRVVANKKLRHLCGYNL